MRLFNGYIKGMRGHPGRELEVKYLRRGIDAIQMSGDKCVWSLGDITMAEEIASVNEKICIGYGACIVACEAEGT